MTQENPQKIPQTMNAFVLHHHGGLDALRYHTDWPVPKPAPHEVLIRVTACGMNNTDINTRSGWYSKNVTEATTGDAYDSVNQNDPTWGGSGIDFPRIQGADVVGIVVGLGADAPKTLMGKRVMTDNWLRDWNEPMNRESARYFGSEKDGGFAQYTTIDARNVAPINSPLSDSELATFSCSTTTAEGMLTRANVTENDRVLITGASGGVGSALIQLARRRGAFVIALAAPIKHAGLAALNPDVLLSRSPSDLPAELTAKTGNARVDVIADIVGGSAFAPLIETLTRGGRYVTSGAIAGPIVDLDLRTLYLNDLTLYGSTVIPPHIFTDVVGYIEAGAIKPMLAATYPLADLHTAQKAFIAKQHSGNIVINP